MPPHMTAIFGAVAAVASSSASFPLEVVRRRAMMGTSPAAGARAALAPSLFRRDDTAVPVMHRDVDEEMKLPCMVSRRGNIAGWEHCTARHVSMAP